MRKFKTDKRLKKLEIELKGEVYGRLPFENLEKYTDENIENIGDSYAYNYEIKGKTDNETIYKYNNELYIVDEIKHFNTELISATLIKLIEY